PEINMTPPDVSGAARVRELVDGGEELKPEAPRPLMRELPPADPFPIDSLGDVLAPAARAIQDRVRAPLAICGQSVLAAANLATQAHVNVVLPIGSGQPKPVSSYFMTVALSGERKSECDRQASWPIRKREKEMRDTYDAELPAYINAKAAWDKARDAAITQRPHLITADWVHTGDSVLNPVNVQATPLAAGYVTVPSLGMALTNAEKQKRWRERHKALERATTDATERALLEQVERCVDLPDQERVALADRVGNEAMVLLWRAHWLGKIGEKVRTGPQDPVFEARAYREARQPDAGRDRDSPQARWLLTVAFSRLERASAQPKKPARRGR